MVKCRSILMVYLLSILTFGIYYLYWAVQTKEEMNSLGRKYSNRVASYNTNSKFVLVV